MEEWEKFFAETPTPKEFQKNTELLKKFVLDHSGKNPIVLVTSGGTTVPLERNTVR